jgi:2-oxoglutarate ferredoxin oxidoreductase subunit gamma
MHKEIMIAGYGGQGVLFAGQILAYTAMDIKMQVTWIPSYGPEMRGGTANCTVVISDQEIGSPQVAEPPIAILLNLPSYDKYEPLIKVGGVAVVNASMVDRGAIRTDIRTIFVEASKIAEEIGDTKLMNMVAVGALLAVLPELDIKEVKNALRLHLPSRHHALLPSNYLALERGFDAAVSQGHG